MKNILTIGRALTTNQLACLDRRVDEIDSIIDLCHPNWDRDVLDNLYYELELFYNQWGNYEDFY